jgi:hypothetical protein
LLHECEKNCSVRYCGPMDAPAASLMTPPLSSLPRERLCRNARDTPFRALCHFERSEKSKFSRIRQTVW